MSEDTDDCTPTHYGDRQGPAPSGAEECFLLLEDGWFLKQEWPVQALVELEQCPT